MTRLQRSTRMVGREFMGEYLLVPLAGKTANLTSIFATNEVGAFIWKQLESPHTQEALVAAIVAEYETTAEQAQRDCGAFLEQLEAVNAIERKL
jgi:hypothetical protein